MSKPPNPFRWFDSSPEVIRLVVMLYVRFPLSLRNVEDLLFERGIDICHETVGCGGTDLAQCSPLKSVGSGSWTCAPIPIGAGTWTRVCREGSCSDVGAELHGR